MKTEPLHYQKWREQHLSSLEGKWVVVTGANSGIGFEASRGFLALGASLIMACRSEKRAAAAKEKLLAEFPHATVEVVLLDLASYASIDAFAEGLKARVEKPHIFLHCAGVYYPKVQRTADGLPATVGINYLGTVRLAEAVRPLMGGADRMIFTVSLVDRYGKMLEGGIEAADEKEGYASYARSKYLLSSYVLHEANRRKEDEPLLFAVHPGITATSLLSPEKTTQKPWFSRLGHAFLYLFTHSPEKASLTALWAATGRGIPNGSCIGPRGLFGISGYPHLTKFCHHVKRRVASMK